MLFLMGGAIEGSRVLTGWLALDRSRLEMRCVELACLIQAPPRQAEAVAMHPAGFVGNVGFPA